MDIVRDTPTALQIPFILGNIPVVPDVGSVTYTILNQAGEPLIGLENISYLTTSTSYQMQILVPSAAHNISAGRRFERRQVRVMFKVQGYEAQLLRTYRVVPESLYSITSNQVRAFIGIEDHELPDSDIDIFLAFLTVEKDIGADTLTTALVSGTTDEVAANTMICMRTVLDVLPSAKQRMAQTEKNGVKQFSRVDLKELDKLKDIAERRYQDAFEQIAPPASSPTVSVLLVSTNTDAITG